MKKVKVLLCLLVMMFCFQLPVTVQKVEAATVKTGLVKKKGKYYYYVKGKKVKNTWKTVKDKKTGEKYKYYFSNKGVAYKGKMWYANTDYEAEEIAVKEIKKQLYGFDSQGRMVKGIVLSYNAEEFSYDFLMFKNNGKMNRSKTDKLNAYSQHGKSWAKLRKLLGKPLNAEELEGGCYGDGTEYLYTYANFKVNTFKPADGGAEIVLGVSSVMK